MINLLTPFGFPEISIIVVLSLAGIILLALIAFILFRTTKKKSKKSSSEGLLEGEPETDSNEMFPGKDANLQEQNRGPIVLPPIILSPFGEPVQQSQGNESGQGQYHSLAVLPPVVLTPPNASTQQDQGNENGQKQGRSPAVLPPTVLPPTVLPPAVPQTQPQK